MRTTETTQNKETFQRAGSRQIYADERQGKATVITSNFA